MTLVETMMALLIFAICIAGICQLMLITGQASDRARDQYIAANIARNRLERAHTFPFGQLYTLAESNVVVDENGAALDSGLFRRTSVVSNVTSALIEFTVTVQVRDRVKRTFTTASQTAQTLLADI